MSEDLREIFGFVDPLDGTANYNRNIPICCVSIGLVKKMQPLIGVIFDFNNGDIFIGDNIKKLARLNNEKIVVSDIHNKTDGVLITGLPFNTDYSDKALEKINLRYASMEKGKNDRVSCNGLMLCCIRKS